MLPAVPLAAVLAGEMAVWPVADGLCEMAMQLVPTLYYQSSWWCQQRLLACAGCMILPIEKVHPSLDHVLC